jgi:hypothetical protein
MGAHGLRQNMQHLGQHLHNYIRLQTILVEHLIFLS